MSKQTATKSIRWTAWILALAALAAVVSMWLSDTTPASASHTNREIHLTVHNPTEGGDGWVQLSTTPYGLYGDMRFDISMSLANGASPADVTSSMVNRRINVYEEADDSRNQNQGFTISETHGSNNVKSIRFPVNARQDLDLDPNEKIRVAVTNVRYDAGCTILPTRKRVCHVAYPLSKTAEVTIVDDDARPSVPGNLRAVPLGPDSVQLTWDASNGGMVNGQGKEVLRYRYDIDGSFGEIPGGNVTSYTMTGLDTVSNSYTFRVRAESDAGNSWFTGNVTSDMFRPGVPGNFRAVPIGPDSFRLTWEASDAGTVNGERQTPDYYEYEIRGQRERPKPIAGDATSFVETGLPTFERTYQFRIRAVIDGAYSEFTPYYNAGNFRPATPTNLTATTIGPDSVLLEWEPQDAGVASDGQPITPRYEYNFDGILGGVPEAGATSHTVTGLDTVNNTYEFRVRAISGDAPSWFTGYVTSELLPVAIESVWINSEPGEDGAYNVGDPILVWVQLNGDITVDGFNNIEMELDFDGTPRTAKLHACCPDNLWFRYLVQVGDEDLDGIAIGADSLGLNGGSITGFNGVAADLSHDAIPADSRHRVDAAAPTVASIGITSDPGPDAFYVSDDSIEVAVTFGKDVTVTGSPQLELDLGGEPRTAELLRVSGARLVFAYVVQEGDEDLNGVAVGANKLTAGAASIQGANGVDADLSHDAVPADANHRVDTVAPTIVSIAITSEPRSGGAGIYVTGDAIEFTVVFSEEMVFDATALLEVEVGGSTVVLLEDLRPITGTDTVVFTYHVQVGDEDQDGVSVPANGLTLFGEDESIRDAAGHDADLSHVALPSDPNHRVSAPGGL